MADTVRKIDIVVGSRYDGAGTKAAAADIAGLNSKLSAMTALRGVPQAGLAKLFGNLNAMGREGGPPIQAIDVGAIENRRKQLEDSQSSMMDELANSRRRGAADYERINAAVHENLAKQRARRDELRDADLARGESFGGEASRMRGGLSESELRGRKATADHEQSFRAQERSLLMAARGFGTIAISDILGRNMQGLADVTDKFAMDMRHGRTKTEAFAVAMSDLIPGAGELAKGFQGLYVFIQDLQHPAAAAERRERERQQVQRDERQKMADAVIAKREPIMLAGREAATSAGARLNLAGVRGSAREAVEIQNQKNEADRKLQELYEKRGNLTTEQQNTLKAQVTAGRKANRIDAEYELEQLNKRTDAAMESDRRQHADRLKSIEDETGQSVLESNHKFYAAKLQAVKDAERQIQLEIIRTRHDESLNPDVDQTKANQRYDAEMAASRARQASRLKQIQEQEQHEIEESDRDHQARMYDARSSQVEKLERLSGDHYKADRESLVRQRQDRITEIDKTQREELRAHGERADQINKQATESRLSAQKDYEVGLLEMQMRLGMQFRVNPTGTTPMGESRLLTGTGSQFKQGGIDADMLATLRKILARLESGQSLLIPGNYPGNN